MLDEKKWVELNKFPEPVILIRGMFEINNVLYIVGYNGISKLNNEIYKFRSNKLYDWCATCRVGNNIIVVCENYNGDVESSLFNPINKQWSDANIEIKRDLFTVVYYLNKVWIIGGCERGDDEFEKTVNTVEVYDPVTQNQILAPIKLNEARYDHRVIVYSNKLFVFGGIDDDGECLNSVEMFSPEDRKFVMMAPMKIARSDFACCRVGNLVYVIGGWTLGGKTKSVEIYNLDRNAWTDGVDFPIVAHELYACAVNNKLQ